jgi:ABC-type nitrate/sulfonate/bicarbonate transport system substrate-binding protein
MVCRPSHQPLARAGVPFVLIALTTALVGCSRPAPSADLSAADSRAPAPAGAPVEQPARPPERFRYGYPSSSLNYFYLFLGEVEGIYARHGLAPELLQLPASTLLAALTAGEVDYTAGAAGGIRLAVLGQPVRLVSSVSLLNFSLVARPEFSTGAALKGQAVGVGSRGASADRALQRAVRSLGLDPQQDVTVIVIGDQPLQWEALRTGRVAALMAAPPTSVQAEREGYPVLANTAALEPAVVGGVAGTIERLAAARERTRRLVVAEAEIARFAKTQREQTIAHIAARYHLTLEDAAVAYAQVVPYYWDQLDFNLEAVDATIAAEREGAQITAEVPRGQVIDPSVLAEARAAGAGR